jgi:hypothetical protein
VVRNALLIDFLFGTLSHFKKQLSEYSGASGGATSCQVELPPRANAEDTLRLAERRAKFRATLLKFKKESPAGTRTDFQLQFGAAALWLRENDNQWYADVLPPIAHSNEATIKRAIEYRVELDNSMLKHVKQRLQSLSADNLRPRRLTASLLLSGHSWSNEYGRMKDDLPKTSLLLKKNVETAQDYKRRLALWLAVHPNVAPEGLDSLEYARISTGLPLYEITRLLRLTKRGKRGGSNR